VPFRHPDPEPSKGHRRLDRGQGIHIADWRGRRRLTLILLGAALLITPVIRAAASSQDTDPAQATLAGWRLAGTYSISTQQQGQGLATVSVPGRAERRYYSGNRSIPAALLSAG
jgi:hypothetical protein